MADYSTRFSCRLDTGSTENAARAVRLFAVYERLMTRHGDIACFEVETDQMEDSPGGDWIDDMIQAGKRFMIYSPNEAQMGQGGGYWSNDDGWVDLDSAAIFDWSERKTFCLPASLGSDADWVEIKSAGTLNPEIHLPAEADQPKIGTVP